MTIDKARAKLNTNPDFIYSTRFDCSLKKLLARYPDGVPDRIIAQVLVMTEEEVEAMWDTVVEKLRSTMGVVI